MVDGRREAGAAHRNAVDLAAGVDLDQVAAGVDADRRPELGGIDPQGLAVVVDEVEEALRRQVGQPLSGRSLRCQAIAGPGAGHQGLSQPQGGPPPAAEIETPMGGVDAEGREVAPRRHRQGLGEARDARQDRLDTGALGGAGPLVER